LDLEQSPTVATVLFDMAVKRADAAFLSPVRSWLDDPVAGDAAADAMWRLLIATAASETELAQTRAELKRAMPSLPTAAQWRLLAFVSDNTDRASLEAVLDGSDIVLRKAVAEGLSRRGVRQPLMDRISEEAVYPFAVQSLTIGPANLDTFRLLVGLQPPNGQEVAWADAVNAVAARLPPASLAAADDLLAAAAWSSPALQSDVLSRVASISTESAPAELRLDLLRRYADALLNQGEAVLAYQVMEPACVGVVPPVLADVRFRAALLTDHFDAAANLHSQPAPWIAVLDEWAARQPAGTANLQQEILRRFDSELTSDQRRRVEQLGRVTDDDAASAAVIVEVQPDSSR
jgi:hypothetical protein